MNLIENIERNNEHLFQFYFQKNNNPVTLKKIT